MGLSIFPCDALTIYPSNMGLNSKPLQFEVLQPPPLNS